MSLRTDERFQISELAVRDDLAAGDCDRIAAGLSEDETLVQDQVGFPGGSYHFEIECLRRQRPDAAAF
jgi:hypothetical protein